MHIDVIEILGSSRPSAAGPSVRVRPEEGLARIKWGPSALKKAKENVLSESSNYAKGLFLISGTHEFNSLKDFLLFSSSFFPESFVR